MAVAAATLSEFPVSSLLPRKETGVISFLSKYPKYDGTGVVIAVFDSGVDPAAAGLQVCTTGAVKVLDRLDASGAGDVITSTMAWASATGLLQGVTGRTLKIPSTWNNPSGEYHIGVKSAYSIYPYKLRDRLMKERKENVFEPQHKKFQEAAMRKLQNERHRTDVPGVNTSSSPTDDTDTSEGAMSCHDKSQACGCSDKRTDCEASSPERLRKTEPPSDSDAPRAEAGSAAHANGADSSSPSMSEVIAQPTVGGEFSSFLEKQQKDDAEAEMTLLNSLHKRHQELGPAYDCVVYHDGLCWRACIDTSECGELSQGVHIGEYRVTHEWAPLTARDNFTVTINVHDEGNLLEIVGMCSSHGTHVSSITAACFPDDPERNGVAPGAQIVSVTIGDNRVHGMETGTAMSRAMSWVMDNPYYKVDVINMSYGEHSHTTSAGRLGELASDVVNKYGVIWVASASNHGPALSTVGSPPDFASDCIMGIGAYVSPEMMAAEYGIMDKLPGAAYTWSSRGPTATGGRGVSVCAPGGAITSMPAFTNKTSQLLNGTSMSSPHAAGCVGLLVSALKHQNYWYNPYSVRRALQNTAQYLPELDPFVQGHGLLQVEKAYNYLVEYGVERDNMSKHLPENNMRFVVECGGHKNANKGIYLRNWEGDKSIDISVCVEPVQFDDTRADNHEKRQLNLDLVFTCDAQWVKAPACLHMSYTSRIFVVRVVPMSLQRGNVYFTTVKAFVSGAPERGPLFEVPVTVVMPIIDLENGTDYKSTSELYRSGCVRRTFIRVPHGATHAHFTIKSTKSDQCQRVGLHAVQLLPQRSVLALDHYKIFNFLYPNEQTSTTFSVRGGLNLEICLARWWCAMHDSSVEFTLSFHGLVIQPCEVTMLSSNPIHRVDTFNYLRTQEMILAAALKNHVQSLTPYETRIEVLGGARDTVPLNKPIYQLVLSYGFTVTKPSDVQPRCTLLSEYLYESAVESQLWLLYDSRKQYICAGDAYSHKYSTKLEKGDYIIRQHVRHDRPDLLEKLQEMPMTISIKLSQEVKLDTYVSYHSALTGGKKMTALVMHSGDIIPVFLTVPNLLDKQFKSLSLGPGHSLTGSITLMKDDNSKKADKYNLRLVITEPVAVKKKVPNFLIELEQKKEFKKMEDYHECVRDVISSWIIKTENESSENLYREHLEAYKSHIPFHVARLLALDAHYNRPCSVGSSNRGPTSPTPGVGSDMVVVEGSGDETAVVQETEPYNEWAEKVTEVAEYVHALVDMPSLLAFIGTKTDTRPDAAKNKAYMERQKQSLIEAYCKVGLAVCQPYVPQVISPHRYTAGDAERSTPPVYDITVPPQPSESVLNSLDSMAAAVLKFVDPADAKAHNFFVAYYQVRRWYATAARLVNKSFDDRNNKDTVLRLTTLYRLLGYHHIVHDMCKSFSLRFPDKFLPF